MKMTVAWRILLGLFLTLIYIHLATTVCGGDIHRKSGFFYSPSPSADQIYPNNTLCNWTITVPNNSIIHFRFTFFDLEESTNCDHDYVEIYDFDGFNKTLIAKFCGHQIPDTVVSKGNQMLVVFGTDSSITFSGFHAIFNTEFFTACGANLTEPSGVITSPNYNATYPQFSFCKWTITAPEDTVVLLGFTSFDVETDQADAYCHNDQLEVYDGNSSDHNLIARLCGFRIPSSILSKGNQMFLLFKSDQSVSKSGFRAVYNTQSCGRHFTEPSGVITSPSYPNVYPAFVSCNWTITVPVGSVISLSFTSFNVEPDPECKFDHLELYDGDSSDKSLIARLCGQHIPPSFSSKGNQMYILFKTDGNKAYPGFRAIYQTINNSSNQTNQLNTDSPLVTTRPHLMTTTSQPETTTLPSTSFAIGHHQIIITPELFQPNTRSTFSVSCSVDNLNRTISYVVSLVLSRQSALTNYTEETIASVTSLQPDRPTLLINTLDAAVEGFLDNNQFNYSLAVKWTFPTSAEEAVYVCEANALNNRGRPVSSKVYATSNINQINISNMTTNELMHSLQVLQNENTRLTEAYLKMSMTSKLLLDYNFYKPFADDHRTKYFLSRFQPLNTSHADEICFRLLGGILVEIDSVAEFSFLQQHLTTVLELNETVLTGATDDTQFGVWTNRHSNVPLPVLKWAASQPNEDYVRHCLALLKTNIGIEMANVACTLKAGNCATPSYVKSRVNWRIRNKIMF